MALHNVKSTLDVLGSVLSANSTESVVSLDDILAFWATPSISFVQLSKHVWSFLDRAHMRSLNST